MKTLNDVTTAIINELLAKGAPFSSHDVTVLARDHVNKSTDVFNIPKKKLNAHNEVYYILHDDVRTIVEGLFTTGELTRHFNGKYNEYQSATGATSLQLSPLQTQLTNRMGIIAVIEGAIASVKSVSNLNTLVAYLDTNPKITDLLSTYSISTTERVLVVSNIALTLRGMDPNFYIDMGYFKSGTTVDEFIDYVLSKLGLKAGDPIDAFLEDEISTLTGAVFPNALPVTPGTASLVDTDRIYDYIKKAIAGDGGNRTVRTVRNIHSMLKQIGLRCIDIKTAIENDPRFKIVVNTSRPSLTQIQLK